jgi:hypothetical protein
MSTHETRNDATRGGPASPTAVALADRVEAALCALAREHYDLTGRRPDTDSEWAQRCSAVARICAQAAGWWGLLVAHECRHLDLHPAFFRAAVIARIQERADARFWRDTARDYRARAEQRPTSDAAGALSNWDELGVTA